jgi:hypothetical protein
MDGSVARVGTFLLLVGGGLMVLFIGSEFSQEPDFNYFFLSLAAFFLGIFLRQRGRAPSENQRFQAYRKMQSANRQRREERREKRKK